MSDYIFKLLLVGQDNAMNIILNFQSDTVNNCTTGKGFLNFSFQGSISCGYVTQFVDIIGHSHHAD